MHVQYFVHIRYIFFLTNTNSLSHGWQYICFFVVVARLRKLIVKITTMITTLEYAYIIHVVHPISQFNRKVVAIGLNHWLINYIDTKSECPYLKILTCKGTVRQVLPEIVDWRYSQSWWYFRSSFMNCSPLTFLCIISTPSHPLPCVNKYTVYTYTVYKVMGS